MFFFIAEFERAAKIRKIAVYRFLISLLVPKAITVLKMSSFRSKSGQKLCRNQSKSIKFVTSCAGHVDGMKKCVDNSPHQLLIRINQNSSDRKYMVLCNC